MNVLVLNAGSSTLKFQMMRMAPSARTAGKPCPLARGLIDRIGEDGICSFSLAGREPEREKTRVRNHEEAVQRVLAWLWKHRATVGDGVDGVGHRVVHGGDRFLTPVLIDNRVLKSIDGLSDLAPLHNPASVSGIRAARRSLGRATPMVAVFDTSFHRSLPAFASTYAIPHRLARRHRIQRYGFHGLAHRSLVLRYAEIRGLPERRINVVTLHLGNGCSASAIRRGKSVETSMGFTPLEGLVMGSRSGDLDPALVRFIGEKEELTAAEVETLLNKEAGLLGISGRSNDMREIIQGARSDGRCRLALEVFCHRAKKYLGAYMAVLGGADAVIFSGGIGENSPEVRARICAGMEWCGLRVDAKLNKARTGREGRISPRRSRPAVYVVPADEERVIALETRRLIRTRT